MNNRQEIIEFIKTKYTTLRGKPVESCSDEQLLAVFYALKERQNKPTLNSQSVIKKESPMKKIYIYTDGACRNNQSNENLGAYAYKLIYGDKLKTYSKAIPNTTNNKMELQAVISALKAIKPTCRHYHIELYTDSMYVVKGSTEWGAGWLKNNFKGVKNTELWKELFELELQFPNLNYNHIQGHAGHKHQEEVDRLCNDAMDVYEECQEIAEECEPCNDTINSYEETAICQDLLAELEERNQLSETESEK